MPSWTFQRQLITGVILIGLLAILTSTASLFTSRVLIAYMAQIATGDGRDLADAKAAQLAGVRDIADAHACLLTSGREFAAAAGAGSDSLRSRIARMRDRATMARARLLLDQVASAEFAHRDAFTHALARPPSSGGPARVLYPESVVSSSARLDRALAELVNDSEAAQRGGLGRSRDAVWRSETFLIVVTTTTILLLILLCMLLIKALNRTYRIQGSALDLAKHAQSEARATLTEVEAASQLKDQFLATVSHELRNPLAPILTWTQLLRSGSLDETKQSRALEVIERNVASLAQLIDDLTDVSRVASGKFRLDVRPIDLAVLIREAAEAQTPASDAKQIRLSLVLDERAGLVSGDSERLRQVLWNVISNAIKFTPKGGRVQVVLQRAESHVEVSVSDSGIGIEHGFLPHVFEPFQQATGGSMRRHGGLGLGLSIVRHIVELHGGEISAYSDGENQGSKFTVKFPLLATAREPSEPARRHPIARDTLADLHLGRLDGVRVLVVEDEPSASEALLVLLQSCGAEARIAGSASEAIAQLDRWQPSVIISDIAMPGEDGYSLLRRIRSRTPEHGGTIPAVALTAYAKIEDRVTILGAGFQMYLSKPADPNELVAVVGSLAKRWAPSGLS